MLHGLALLRAREYFAAHEALEEAWRELEGREPAWRDVLQGLIQLAVALEHLRRDNALGAFNVWQRARGKLRKVPAWVAGIGVAEWGTRIEAHFGAAGLSERVKMQLEGGVAAGEEHIQASDLPPLPPPEAWPVPPLRNELVARLPAL